jgi:hypothetical protein
MPPLPSLLLVSLSAAFACTGCSQSRRAPDADDRVATPVPSSGTPLEAREPGELRALEDDELTPAIIDVAQEILEQHHDQPLGYEVPFELEGRRYVARLEQHYRPPGSGAGPIGEHVGVTVYAVD